MVHAFGGPAEHVVVPGVGHAAHLEDPDTTTTAIRRFLRDLGTDPS
jgi:pimeloyl-ACP methyl ester carboxylesterase